MIMETNFLWALTNLEKEITLFMKHLLMNICSSLNSIFPDELHKNVHQFFFAFLLVLPLLTTAVMDTCIIAKISKGNEI